MELKNRLLLKFEVSGFFAQAEFSRNGCFLDNRFLDMRSLPTATALQELGNVQVGRNHGLSGLLLIAYRRI